MREILIFLMLAALVSGCVQQGAQNMQGTGRPPVGAPGPTPSEYIPESVGNFIGDEIRTISCGRDPSVIDGKGYYYTQKETGTKYFVNVIDKINGELPCTAGAINYFEDSYFSSRCNSRMIKYKGIEIVSDRGGEGVYFFWISDNSSVMVNEDIEWPSGIYRNSPEGKEFINSSLQRAMPLIDYYLEKYPSVKRCS